MLRARRQPCIWQRYQDKKAANSITFAFRGGPRNEANPRRKSGRDTARAPAELSIGAREFRRRCTHLRVSALVQACYKNGLGFSVGQRGAPVGSAHPGDRRQLGRNCRRPGLSECLLPAQGPSVPIRPPLSAIGVDRALALTTTRDRNWDSRDGHAGAFAITRGWRKSAAMSHPFRWGVAKTIHVSGNAATSALGRLQTFRLSPGIVRCTTLTSPALGGCRPASICQKCSGNASIGPGRCQ